MYNKTTYFLLPLVDINRIDLSKWLINTYLGNSYQENTHRYWIFIELTQNVLQDNKTVIPVLESNPNYINKYIINDSIVVVMEIPDNFKIDYDRFVIGLYTKMSKEAKDLIIANLQIESNYYKSLRLSSEDFSKKDKIYYKNVLNPTPADFERLYEFLKPRYVSKFDEVQRDINYSNDLLHKFILERGEILNKPFYQLDVEDYDGECIEWLGELDKTNDNFNKICKI